MPTTSNVPSAASSFWSEFTCCSSSRPVHEHSFLCLFVPLCGSLRFMKIFAPLRLCVFALFSVVLSSLAAERPVRLFDGKTFRGWEGDTNNTFRIQDSAIMGGSLKDKIPR